MELPEKEFFLHQCKGFFEQILKEMDFENWKTEVLTSRQLSLLAHSTSEAIQQYFQLKFEDAICLFIREIV